MSESDDQVLEALREIRGYTAQIRGLSVVPKAYSVDEFCKAHRIGRSLLYKLWNAGAGPPRVKFGRRSVIPRAAGDAWFETQWRKPDEA